MPHLRIEYAAQMAQHIEALCHAAHEAMVTSGVFPLGGIRVRAHQCDWALVADLHPDNGFVAMELAVGAGRDAAVLQAAGDQIFAAVKAVLADDLEQGHGMLSLEIREIDAALSWKANGVHARLRREEHP